MADVRVYRLSPEGMAEFLRRRQILSGVFLAIVVAGSMGWLASVGRFGPTPLALGLVLLLLMLVPAFVLGRRRARAAYQAFGLALGQDVIRCVQLDVPPVEMFRTEVTKLVEGRTGLLLRAEAPARAIVVPSRLDGYAEARAQLVTWRTPEPMSAASRRRRVGLLAAALLLIPSYLLGQFAPSTTLALLGTVLFGGLGAWMLFTVVREPLVSGRLKVLLLVVVGWFAVSLLSRWGLPP
jgi:hypothetical protein